MVGVSIKEKEESVLLAQKKNFKRNNKQFDSCFSQGCHTRTGPAGSTGKIGNWPCDRSGYHPQLGLGVTRLKTG